MGLAGGWTQHWVTWLRDERTSLGRFGAKAATREGAGGRDHSTPPGLTCGRLRRSSVVSAVGAWAAFAGYRCSPRLEPNGSNPGGGNTRDYLHERRRPDSNRGIKALQASALPLGYGA